MQLVEDRELDGPNLFLLEPAIKIEFAFDGEADLAAAAERSRARLAANHLDIGDDSRVLLAALRLALRRLSIDSEHPPASVWKPLDAEGHFVFAVGWSERARARYIAEQLVELAAGDRDEPWPSRPYEPSSTEPDPPLWIRDGKRRAKIVAITGTNGKTTTTRLVSHTLMRAGFHVGWSSSSGVYIDGQEVLKGDYSGPSGARRVLEDPSVEFAVLESARGGILLRGLAFESSDVSVFINVSRDHLGLQGVMTLKTLSEVKAVVISTTTPNGFVVLNADDPQVLSAAAAVRGQKILISQNPSNPAVAAHLAGGGRAVVATEGEFRIVSREAAATILPVSDAPIAYGGRAVHMIENALCAAGACLGLGLSSDAIADGLRSFRNTTEQNHGRLNIFDVNGATVVMDYAHNVSGLAHLLSLSRSFAPKPARLIAVIGTAGDREDAVLRDLGRLAGEASDQVVIKRGAHYLRGRSQGEMIALFRAGVALNAGAPEPLLAGSEMEGLDTALGLAAPGDAIAVMCHEQMDEMIARLNAIGSPL